MSHCHDTVIEVINWSYAKCGWSQILYFIVFHDINVVAIFFKIKNKLPLSSDSGFLSTHYFWTLVQLYVTSVNNWQFKNKILSCERNSAGDVLLVAELAFKKIPNAK